MRPTSFIPDSEARTADDTAAVADGRRIRVLLEMRPALDGFAGIPQETRLLFRGLRMIGGVQVAGMIQSSVRTLAHGTRPGARGRLTEARRINRYSRVIISLAERGNITLFDKARAGLLKTFATSALTLSTLLRLRKIRLTEFDPTHFTDFVWGALFSKSLPSSDHDLVTSAEFRVCATPWRRMHTVGLHSLNVSRSPIYPLLETHGVDIFIGQTPYPARLPRETACVIRYHDAVPVFLPHTISDKSMHQSTHFYALMANVRAGAWFACVSETTRQDLLKLFPEAEPRAVTIHNMVSHHYFSGREEPARIPQIVRTRLHQVEVNVPVEHTLALPLAAREQESFYRRAFGTGPLRYLLVVSTIEPRKNHARLLSAWEELKTHTDPNLKLIVVGQLGWDHGPFVRRCRPWIERGEIFALTGVPSDDLRALYQHAAATVCPSIGEGFDFSGVEAMASRGVTVASDIPVHREIYEDAAEYFNPYSTMSLANVLRAVLYGENAAAIQARLRARGTEIAARYQPDRILPRWEQFLARVASEHAARVT